VYGLKHDSTTLKPSWHLIYTSEIFENTRSPKWQIFCLKIWSLCENDYYRPILIKVWDHSASFGAPEFIGEVQTNLKEILVKSVGQGRFNLVHPTRHRNQITAQARVPGSQTAPSKSVFNQNTTPTIGSASAAYESSGSLVFTYARVFSDIKFSAIERAGNGYPADIAPLVQQKPIA
jgi:hypothetical protein